jgi:hypothetical protein
MSQTAEQVLENDRTGCGACASAVMRNIKRLDQAEQRAYSRTTSSLEGE